MKGIKWKGKFYGVKMSNICLVTPLKDEIENIPDLIKSIESQEKPIYCWIIVENGSTDGSREYLEQIDSVKNVTKFIVLNFSLSNERYELGVKYSTVVNQGFKLALKCVEDAQFEELAYIGICDADCFPEPNYYKDLIKFMECEQLDISSGVGVFENGVGDGEAKEWVRGNCRLWKFGCFLSAGYIVGPSADTLSLGKAELLGFKAYPNHDLVYKCREMGSRSRYSYYGYSSYYRGITPFYAVLKFFNYLRIGQTKQSYEYLFGYFSSYFKRKDRLQDYELRRYFSNTFIRKITKRYRK